MPILAIDVYYYDDHANVAGILFEWNDDVPRKEITVQHADLKPYQAGAFFQRELPCIQALLANLDLSTLEAILVDGYVYTDNEYSLGLGGKLYEAIGGACPVIGVAKNILVGNEQACVPVLRGKSKKPLFVSAIGTDVHKTADLVRHMHGEYRIPTVLTRLDQLSRSHLQIASQPRHPKRSQRQQAEALPEETPLVVAADSADENPTGDEGKQKPSAYEQ